MILELWYDSTQPPLDTPENEDWNAVKMLWDNLRQRARLKCEQVDTADFSDKERTEAYDRTAVVASTWKHYRVSKLFWKGRAFGKAIAALVVWDTDRKGVPDVYPHMEGEHLVTIHSCLKRLVTELGLGS